MNQTKIEWTDVTWNVVTGCSKVSAGCANCYAERMAKRLAGRCGYPKENPFAVTFHPDRLEMPMRLKKPSRIFVNSMGDLFHPEVKGEWLSQVFSAMANAHWIKGHTFSVLTKRPERMKSVIEEIGENLAEQRKGVKNPDGSTTHKVTFTFPLKGVELGVSVEDQKTADERIPILLQTPAAMRFVSYEPALGPVVFNGPAGGGKIDLIIMGGETGPGARPMNPEWARKVRDDCAAAGVPFFFKGWGEWAPCPDEEWHGLGPTGRPKQLCVSLDGKHTAGGFMGKVFAAQMEAEGWRPAQRIGKREAGHLLDGREHREFPKEGR